MGKKILTKRQLVVLEAVGSEPKLSGFYLSGGTALAAFYLQHRLSDDLDFFTAEVVDIHTVGSFTESLKKKLNADKVIFEKLYDRRLFTFKWKSEELKLEFTTYPFVQFERPKPTNSKVKTDSFRDISANKLMALLDRFEPKDFVDLFFILKKCKLPELVKDTEKKFGVTIDPLFLGGELAKVTRIESLPHMLKSLTVSELKSFFTKKALELKPQIF